MSKNARANYGEIWRNNQKYFINNQQLCRVPVDPTKPPTSEVQNGSRKNSNSKILNSQHTQKFPKTIIFSNFPVISSKFYQISPKILLNYAP